MAYSIVIEPVAIQDIQEVIDYYDEQQPGLGEKFEGTLNKHLIALKKNPFFQVRYDNTHCLPLKKYPYMIHFTVDEKHKEVTVRAIFNTSRDPKIWKRKK
ncbi:type II toxin-antitoxin system RelE/ParE family toxin [Sinomicrobium sp. M5D2P9]